MDLARVPSYPSTNIEPDFLTSLKHFSKKTTPSSISSTFVCSLRPPTAPAPEALVPSDLHHVAISTKTRERERLHEEAEALAADAVAAERERSTEREAEARKLGAVEAAAAFDRTRAGDRRLADEEWALKLAAADERARDDIAAVRTAEEDARRQASENAEVARAALENELAAVRERAVKLEGGKWQRASEEAEARAIAEKVRMSHS